MRIFRSIFLISKTTSEGISARVIGKRPLLLPRGTASSIGRRTLFWFLIVETAASFALSGAFYLFGGIILICMQWFSSGAEISALLPLILMPFKPGITVITETIDFLLVPSVEPVPVSWFTRV